MLERATSRLEGGGINRINIRSLKLFSRRAVWKQADTPDTLDTDTISGRWGRVSPLAWGGLWGIGPCAARFRGGGRSRPSLFALTHGSGTAAGWVSAPPTMTSRVPTKMVIIQGHQREMNGR
jgi:hypothetical protein